eukprot:scaffold11725_cov116-Cylindrotheca_fusiformis.AAC.3
MSRLSSVLQSDSLANTLTTKTPNTKVPNSGRKEKGTTATPLVGHKLSTSHSALHHGILPENEPFQGNYHFDDLSYSVWNDESVIGQRGKLREESLGKRMVDAWMNYESHVSNDCARPSTSNRQKMPLIIPLKFSTVLAEDRRRTFCK